MKFDLTNQGATGEWFPFFQSEVGKDGEIVYLEPEENGTSVQIRVADSETMEKIQAETRTRKHDFVPNPKTRQMERVTYIDQTPAQEKKERELIWDFAIQDWKGVLDTDGNEVPCTTENKLLLMNNVQFARFVGRCLQLITSSAEERKKLQEKN